MQLSERILSELATWREIYFRTRVLLHPSLSLSLSHTYIFPSETVIKFKQNYSLLEFKQIPTLRLFRYGVHARRVGEEMSEEPRVALKLPSSVNTSVFSLARRCTGESRPAYFHFPSLVPPLHYVIAIPCLRRILKSASIRLSPDRMQFDRNIRDRCRVTEQTLLYSINIRSFV